MVHVFETSYPDRRDYRGRPVDRDDRLMGFLKDSWKVISGAVLFMLAAFAAASAARHKKTAEKWRAQSETDAMADVGNATQAAKAALSQAKLHDVRAADAKLKARDKLDRIGEKDEELSATLDRWRVSNRMRNRS